MRYIVLYTRYYWVYWKLSKEMFVTMFGLAELNTRGWGHLVQL